MNNKLMIILGVLLLFLPCVLSEVKVQLGEPYVNVESFSEIRFKEHSNYYDICSLDETIIPVVVRNNNDFTDMFTFSVNRDYASLPASSAILGSGKSSILPLILNPPLDIEENTSLMLDIVTKKEGLKRSLVIKTNIKKCYEFKLSIDEENEEICGCDEEVYRVMLTNEGSYEDTFDLRLDIPKWINSSLVNGSIKLFDGQEKEIKLGANPSCEEKGTFNIDVEAVSEKSNVVFKDGLEVKVLPQKECYNTVIGVDDVSIDYFGRNIPITLKNKGAKDMGYSLTAEGVSWYSLSQTNFSIDSGGEKTVNLALYPGENVVEGDYNIDIKAIGAGREFTKSIEVKLRSKGGGFGKLGFYLNYFRYYIILGFVLLVAILLLMVLIKKRMKERPKVEKKEVKKVVKKKAEEKKVVEKKVIKVKPWVKWLLSFVVYIIFLGLLGLLVYSTFRYRSYYEKVLNFISGLFVNYIVPYGSYMKYVVLGLGIVGVVILVLDFYRKRIVKEKEKPKKEKKVEKKVEEKKVVEKKVIEKVEKRKLRLFEYVYLIFVVLLFLSVVVYSIYKFSGGKFALLIGYIKAYALYLIIGIVVLALAIFIINLMKNKGKGVKKTKKVQMKKVAKKMSKKTKKLVRNIEIIVLGLIILSGIIYSFVYFNLVNYIKEFFVVYYPYVLMGIGILVILILILNFHSKKIS